MRSVVAVVRCASDRGEADVAAAVERARGFLEPVLGPGLRCTFVWIERLRAAVVLLGCEEHHASAAAVVTWGQAIGTDGPATETEIHHALELPEVHARRLHGRFVLMRFGADEVTMVSSATTMHTLKRAEGRLGQCWSTHGLTALILAGESPELNEAAVPEFVVFDFVLGEDELLSGTKSLPDAHLVRISEEAVEEGSYWTREERLGASESVETSSGDLRQVLRETLLPVGRHPDLALGLTAGRDSTLLASVFAESSARVNTFTLGEPWWSDPRGAAAVSKHLGWQHVSVGSPHVRRDWARMVELSAWTEGMLTGADLADPIFEWAARDCVWLSGSGGEIGRMWYGQAYRNVSHWLESMRERVGDAMAPTAAELFSDRLGRELALASDLRGDDALDVLYITGRMAKWTARLPPGPHIQDVIGGFLHPAVVECLLNLPEADRRSGSAFAEAQKWEGPDLHAIAARASHVAWPQRDVHRFRFRRVDRRATQRLASHLGSLGPESATRRILGGRWWDTTMARLATDPAVRRQAWNALAVEALSQLVDGQLTRSLHRADPAAGDLRWLNHRGGRG